MADWVIIGFLCWRVRPLPCVLCNSFNDGARRIFLDAEDCLVRQLLGRLAHVGAHILNSAHLRGDSDVFTNTKASKGVFVVNFACFVADSHIYYYLWLLISATK